MNDWDPIGPGGALGSPAAGLRAALLLMAMMMTAVFVPFAHSYGPMLNQVPMNLREDVDDDPVVGRYHQVEIGPDERIRVDGRLQSGFMDYRRALDIIGADRASGVELRPDPNLRYEYFLEVLAIAKRAGLRHLRVAGEDDVYPAPPVP